jgi:hypothetical protein
LLHDAPLAFDDWVRFQREYWHLHVEELCVQLPFLQFRADDHPLFLPL